MLSVMLKASLAASWVMAWPQVVANGQSKVPTGEPRCMGMSIDESGFSQSKFPQKLLKLLT